MTFIKNILKVWLRSVIALFVPAYWYRQTLAHICAKISIKNYIISIHKGITYLWQPIRIQDTSFLILKKKIGKGNVKNAHIVIARHCHNVQ